MQSIPERICDKLTDAQLDTMILQSAQTVAYQISKITDIISKKGIQALRPCEVTLPVRTIESLARLRLVLFGIQPGDPKLIDYLQPEEDFRAGLKKLEIEAADAANLSH